MVLSLSPCFLMDSYPTCARHRIGHEFLSLIGRWNESWWKTAHMIWLFWLHSAWNMPLGGNLQKSWESFNLQGVVQSLNLITNCVLFPNHDLDMMLHSELTELSYWQWIHLILCKLEESDRYETLTDPHDAPLSHLEPGMGKSCIKKLFTEGW